MNLSCADDWFLEGKVWQALDQLGDSPVNFLSSQNWGLLILNELGNRKLMS